MKSTLMSDALKNAGVVLTEEEQKKEQQVREDKHRAKTEVSRPEEEFRLRAITEEVFERKKYQKDPTDDLVELKPNLDEDDVRDVYAGGAGYAVWCHDTLQLWYAHTQMCLDQNFIYRTDLQIFSVNTADDLVKAYNEFVANVNPGIITRKCCYILDNPAAETYEVYYEAAYPSIKYGKATPNGMFVHKYDNRFHRDMRIIELDKLYADSSKKEAGELIYKNMDADEAIVISDGCWMKDTCASAMYYIDNACIVKLAYAALPTEVDQAVLIAEINGAYQALNMCKFHGKKKIKYYYDNTSIINIFRNRKTEYIEEIKAYKSLVEEMDADGYEIEFIELHPKTGDDRDQNNAGLMFFHNYCDKECRELSDIFRKDYKQIAAAGDREGKSFKQVKENFKPKGKPGQSNGRHDHPTNNQRNGNNRYGKRF